MADTFYVQRDEFENFKKRVRYSFRSSSSVEVDSTNSIPFNAQSSVIEPVEVDGPITFTADETGAVAGYGASRRVIADGVNQPVLTGFKRMLGSTLYDNTEGVLNLFLFYYDGVDFWYSVTQEADPTTTTSTTTTTTSAESLVEINFETKDASLIESPSNTWISNTLDNVFAHRGLSNLSLPADTTGYIMCDFADASSINAPFGFSTTNALTGYAAMLAGIDIGADGIVYRLPEVGGAGGSVPAAGKCRVHRQMPAGTITIQTSPDGSNWTTIYTYPSTSTAELFITCDIYGSSPTSGKLVNPQGVGIT